MLHRRLMLITLVQGQEPKKKKAQGSRCGEEGTPGGKLLPRVGTERNNSSPHERCRRCVHCVWAKRSLWMSSDQPSSNHWIIQKNMGTNERKWRLTYFQCALSKKSKPQSSKSVLLNWAWTMCISDNELMKLPIKAWKTGLGPLSWQNNERT